MSSQKKETLMIALIGDITGAGMISLKVRVRQVGEGWDRETNHPPPAIIRKGKGLTLNPEMSSLEEGKHRSKGIN